MARSTFNLYRIAEQCGVKITDVSKARKVRRPGECYCKSALRWVGNEYGEGQLRLVLMLMTGTRANRTNLHSDLVKAVARLLASDPAIVRRPRLIDEFNAIDLGQIRNQAISVRSEASLADVNTILLRLHFNRLTEDDSDEPMAIAA